MEYIVTQSEKSTRLDVFLSEKCNLTRSFIKTLIENKKVLVNEKLPTKAGYQVNVDDKITIDVPENENVDIAPQNLDIDIVYQDDDVVVINKHQGMVVHPTNTLREGTLVNALLYHIKDLSGINGKIRPGIVHRIDKDTSGLIVVAKNDFAHLELQKQIQEKTCKRSYLALTYGQFKNEQGEIENYLDRSKNNYEKFVVAPFGQGKYAKTLYKVVEYNNGFSLVHFELKTGRTHQIRVHSSFMGHPIVGDKVYGKKDEKFKLNGQLLHAFKLSFVHPRSLKQLSFVCPIPDYFKNFLAKVGINTDIDYQNL